MSNQACLFANDNPLPCNPHAEDSDAATDARILAEADYAVPVFWLACFDTNHLVILDVDGDGTLTTVVAPLDEVRQRLAQRDAALRELFPHYTDSWDAWRSLLDTVEEGFLKLDASEISALADTDQQFREQITAALAWFDSREEFDLECLLALSGIEDYDPEEHAIEFDPEEEDVEKFLLGWIEDEA